MCVLVYFDDHVSVLEYVLVYLNICAGVLECLYWFTRMYVLMYLNTCVDIILE